MMKSSRKYPGTSILKKMVNYLFRRWIHPQCALGVAFGLTLTLIIHSQSDVDVVYDPPSLSDARHEAVMKEVYPSLLFGKDSTVRHSFPVGDNTSRAYQQFDDAHIHKDDDTVARALFKQVKVLCWIMTKPGNTDRRAIHVKNTWARRCNVVLFMSSEEDKKLPTVKLNITESRRNLTLKTMKALSYIYDNHLEDADWFLKADDDTYVIMENLRYFLSNEDPKEPVYFGHRFRFYSPLGYPSGGSGYVMSKEAIRRFGQKGRHDRSVCIIDEGAEDANVGICMYNLGVELKTAMDSLGRSRFHCFTPETFAHIMLPKWYYRYVLDKAHGGISNMSDYSISFHYLPGHRMRAMEYFVYHIRAHGIINKLQDINVKRKKGLR